MKQMTQIFSDLKKGENIDVYITVLITIILAFVVLFAHINPVVITSIILAALGILTTAALKNNNNYQTINKEMQRLRTVSKDTNTEVLKTMTEIMKEQDYGNYALQGLQKTTEEISSKVIISKSILETNLNNITMQTIDIDWEDLFKKSNQIDLFFTYARTWRNINSVYLDQFVKTKGNQMRVVLPDPNNEIILHELSNRFSKSTDEFKSLIEEATREYIKLYEIAKKNGAKLEIWHTFVTPMYSMYRFDKTVILALGSYKETKGFVPHFIASEGGTLYNFVQEEFNTIIGHDGRLISRQIDLD